MHIPNKSEHTELGQILAEIQTPETPRSNAPTGHEVQGQNGELITLSGNPPLTKSE